MSILAPWRRAHVDAEDLASVGTTWHRRPRGPSVLSGLRRSVRRSVDRVFLPYVERIERCVAVVESAPKVPVADHDAIDESSDDHDNMADRPDVGATTDRFHAVNHELRTLELERLRSPSDPPFERVLSVGAQGTWYFEWFRHAVGDVTEHIGVEAYEPQPDDLPDYVSWVTDTADQMAHVQSGSVDLVFAGQTSEHLWAHELVGFLTEAHRVIRLGGRLVLDSPNREVTQHLHWSHGGHTIELDHHEMSELLGLAGFDVEQVHGIWACILDGRVLALEEGLDDPAIVTRRIALGRERPEASFVWWIDARRVDRDPDVSTLRARVAELFERHWCVRVSRGFFDDVETPRAVPAGTHAPAATTLPFLLHQGAWRCALTLAKGSWDDVESLQVTIDAPDDIRVHTLDLVDAEHDGATISWRLEQPYLLFALTLSVSITAEADIVIASPIELTPIDVAS